jgi:DNA-binding phage protein
MTRDIGDMLQGDAEMRAIAAEEQALVNACVMLTDAMLKTRVSRTSMAHRLGISPARITQMLDGSQNLTIRTIAKFLHAVDMELHMEARPSMQCLGIVRSPARRNTTFAQEPRRQFGLPVPRALDWSGHTGPTGRQSTPNEKPDIKLAS